MMNITVLASARGAGGTGVRAGWVAAGAGAELGWLAGGCAFATGRGSVFASAGVSPAGGRSALSAGSSTSRKPILWKPASVAFVTVATTAPLGTESAGRTISPAPSGRLAFRPRRPFQSSVSLAEFFRSPGMEYVTIGGAPDRPVVMLMDTCPASACRSRPPSAVRGGVQSLKAAGLAFGLPGLRWSVLANVRFPAPHSAAAVSAARRSV